MRVDVMGADAVWLPSDIDERELEMFLTNDAYCAQTKEDGVHVLASRNAAGRVDTRNRRGELHSVPPALAQIIERWPPETMVDGEKLHEGGFVAFDLLYLAGEDLRNFPYRERLLRLTQFVLATESPFFRVVETALTTEAKRALVEKVRAANGEGIILKDLRSAYTPGRTAWGWTMRRLKFLKSMTAVIMRRPADYRGKDANKASFELFLMENGQWVNIGTVSAQQFFERLQPGESAVAEVLYLYSTPGNRVVQPRLKRPDPFRSDKRPEDCTITQLVKGGRFAGQ